MTLMISAGCREITAQGEMSEKGGPWKPDLGLTYVRVDEGRG